MLKKTIFSKNFSKKNINLKEKPKYLKNIPLLRFKEYNAEWKLQKLGDISSITTGSKNLKDNDPNGKYPFYVRSKNIEHINSYSYDGEAILIPGDGKIGKIFHYVNGKFDYHQRVYKISDFKNVEGKFIYYYLQKNFLHHALKHSLKATVDSLRLPVIKEMKIYFPTLDEQKRIVSLLSKIDTKISLMEQKYDVIKISKKIILQQLYLENISEVESKIFQDKWDVKKLDEIAEIGDGIHKTPNYVKNGIKFISVKDIHDFSKTTKFIKKEEYDKYKMKTQKKNDIFLTRVGTVGKSNILKENEDYAYYVNISLIRADEKINPDYLNQYIKTDSFQRELCKRTLYNTMPIINIKDLKQCLVVFPIMEDQIKIGNLLVIFDEKLRLNQKQIELMKKFKSNLLQKMLV